jgi:hypothetical protein
MLFGKIKGSENEWGFSLTSKNLESFIEMDDKSHMEIVDKANQEGKLIKGDKNGNPVLVDPPPPTEEEVNRNRISELENYLKKTDWYVIRYADSGTSIPDEIKQKRAAARIEISKLREIVSVVVK